MSIQNAPELTSPREQVDKDDWEPPAPPTDLIFDDDEPMETPRHRQIMNVLIRSTRREIAQQRSDFFCGGNMFIYYSSTQARNRDFKGPDFFVVLGVSPNPARLGWVVWQEEGRYPDVIVELLSDSTRSKDFGDQKDLYESTFKTPDYFVYDPYNPTSLQGWHLNDRQRYQPIETNEQGWLWCQTLELWLGTWEGEIDRESGIWLRFFDREGNLVLLAEEAERQRAETAEQRAATAEQHSARLAERLRQLGENPEEI